MRFLVAVALGLVTVACDDGTLPLSEYDKLDVNVYFYFPDSREVYLGETRGASSCGDMANRYAASKNTTRSDRWSYICCTIEKGSNCYRKIR